jgi:iron-sulfur cluster assembly protein
MSKGRIMSITSRAAKRVGDMISAKNDPQIIGVRVGLRTRGCNGLTYTMDYAKEGSIGKFDEVVKENGITAVVDSNAVMFLLGTEMDYESDALSSEFIFNNPNKTAECGCGESFSVDKTIPGQKGSG